MREDGRLRRSERFACVIKLNTELMDTKIVAGQGKCDVGGLSNQRRPYAWPIADGLLSSPLHALLPAGKAGRKAAS